jgi:20S proteasome subunit beta 4
VPSPDRASAASVPALTKEKKGTLTPTPQKNKNKTNQQSPYHCNLLIAGYDEGVGPSIYWLDYLATLHKVNTGGTGYGSYFALSLLDRLWRPDLTLDEAVEVMEKAIAEVRLRLAVAPSKYVIKVVDKDGVRELKRL